MIEPKSPEGEQDRKRYPPTQYFLHYLHVRISHITYLFQLMQKGPLAWKSFTFF